VVLFVHRVTRDKSLFVLFSGFSCYYVELPEMLNHTQEQHTDSQNHQVLGSKMRNRKEIKQCEFISLLV